MTSSHEKSLVAAVVSWWAGMRRRADGAALRDLAALRRSKDTIDVLAVPSACRLVDSGASVEQQDALANCAMILSHVSMDAPGVSLGRHLGGGGESPALPPHRLRLLDSRRNEAKTMVVALVRLARRCGGRMPVRSLAAFVLAWGGKGGESEMRRFLFDYHGGSDPLEQSDSVAAPEPSSIKTGEQPDE